MSDFDNVLGDDSRPASLPVSQPADTRPVVVLGPLTEPSMVRKGLPGWLGFVLAFLATLFFILWLTTFAGMQPGPGPSPEPVDGTYVAVFYQDEDKDKYTPDQVAAMDSAAVAQFLDEHVTGWKKIDVDQIAELKNLHPVYRELADMHRTRLPWIAGRSGRRTISEEIKTPDKLIQDVERLLK